MTKIRTYMTKTLYDAVLKEFNYRCALCGTDRPQVHHLDEDPSNNARENLMALCPNCHLSDQHDPTRQIDPAILKLFRQYKDPAIVKPQFRALYARLKFLETIQDNSDSDDLEARAGELADFVSALRMGSFYAKQIRTLLDKPQYSYSVGPDEASQREYQERVRREEREYREQLREAKDKAYSLAVELLRFQNWLKKRGRYPNPARGDW